MKKHAVKFILVALIVSIALIGCDDAFQRVSQTDANNIAFAAVLAFGSSATYFEAETDENDPFDLKGIGDNGLTYTSTGTTITMNWSNFDVGASLIALFDDETVPESYKPDEDDLIEEGQLVIVSGSATGSQSTNSVDATMKLKIDGFEDVGVPSGTYNIVITMRDSDGMSMTITVNGVKANLEVRP